MKTRKREYGNSNVIGKRVEQLRKSKGIKQKDFIARLQAAGLDINPTSYSKLEGQIRIVSDREVLAISRALGVSIQELYTQE
ncbi:MAG: helix-turn-helix transcriptional regulator [Oscillospiraceae bacterium]|nr:helix-turn-helix transcriptional regulator [Oscillospiraceae bacterium]